MTLEISQTKKKILVVDDDPGMLRLISTMANPAQYNIVCVLGSEEAINLIGKEGVQQFHAIVLDYHMPVYNGLDLLAYIRARDPSISAIIMTAEHDVEVVTQALRFGACDFINKPFRFRQLLDAVDKAVQLTLEQRYLESMASEIHEIIDIHKRINATANLIEKKRYMDRYSVSLETIFYPIKVTGGDFAHCFPVSEDRLLLAVGDVSGHDITAGFISSYFRGIVRGMVTMGADVKTICRHFNEFLINEWNHPRHSGVITSIAVCFMMLDFREGVIRVVAQGFPHPWLANSDAEIVQLTEGREALGWFKDLDIQEMVYALPDNGTCLLWSDGLLDLAEDQQLCPFSLAHYLLSDVDTVQRQRILQKRKDDIVVMRITWSDESHSDKGEIQWSKCRPIYLGICNGGEVDRIDEIQASWKRCLVLMFSSLPADKLHEIILCIREAVLNAMLHGCCKDKKHECRVQIAFDAARKILMIRVDDEGCGYNQSEITAQADANDHVSLGLQIIRYYTDSISLNRNGAALTMTFDLAKELN
ncbi:MAG: response regulator [Opitutales bacterium]|nr:response regulator [Opitutales bacterium]